MRLVIDLQALQAASAAQLSSYLPLLECLVQQAAQVGYQVAALLNLQSLQNNDVLRDRLSRALPSLHIHAMSLPQAAADAWSQRSQQALRGFFLQQLRPDVIYIPFWQLTPVANHASFQPIYRLERHVPNTVCVFHQLQALALPNEVGQAITPENSAWHFEQQAVLQQATLLISNCAQAKQQLAQLAKLMPHLATEYIAPALPAAFAAALALAPTPVQKTPQILLAQAPQLRSAVGDVCEALSQLESNYQIVVLGAVEEQARQHLQEIVQRYPKLEHALQFATPADEAQLLNLLRGASCMLFYAAEQSEIGLQAMAAGLPLVCQEDLDLAVWQGQAEANFSDLSAMAGSLQWLLQNDEVQHELGARNQAFVSQTSLAQSAQQILASLQQAQQQILHTAPANQQVRPRLAYVSPLPPQKSGIADYSVELIPELARFFEIDLILDQASVDIPTTCTSFTQRSVAWFDAHAEQFEHILYHFGNSPAHQHMFALAERHPGVVVLHDFYLGNVLDYLHHTDYLPHAFMRALYQSHGFSAILDQQQSSVNASIWKYPCNKNLLDKADGVIVHSAYPTQLARQWYGAQAAQDWQVLPLLRGKPAQHSNRQAARKALGWQDTDYVLCSYGMLGRTKNNLEVLQAWLASSLAQDPHCHLIFVGANDAGEYGAQLQAEIAAAKMGKRIRITGFVSHAEYVEWLLAADCAVQLRSNSRGETSAAVLDCLLYGVPSIINAHGSSAELPKDVVLQLEDACSQAQLSEAFEQLWQTPALREQLQHAGEAYIAREHAPAQVGAQYQQALQHFAQHGKHRAYQQLLKDLAQCAAQQDEAQPVSEAAWIALAAALANNQLPSAPRQVFVDISAMVQTDLKTGIQRVVRSILQALLAAPPAGFRIEPVFTLGQGKPYHYARQYMRKMLGCAELGLEDSPIHARAGDVFLGLDLFMGGTSQNRAILEQMRQRGVQIHFVVYDILPVLRPDVFPTGAEHDFAQWLHHISSVADGLVCISRAVADQLHTYLSAHAPQRQRSLQLGYFHLGADIDASAPSKGMPDNAEQILAATRARPSLLMVGTVEPRKGYAQALAAFDLLWQQGVDVNLLIVGKQGWMVEQIAKSLQQHPEKEQRLFWLQGVSDEMLLALYQASSGLLAASEGEGFGLPLIEAAQHGLPIIARKLPVFQEVMGEFGYYFDGMQAQDLASALQTWLSLLASGDAPQSRTMPWLTWQQSALQLQQAVFEGQWYRQFEQPN